MRVYLVHHADAVGPHVDAQRPLSTRGLVQANTIALRAKEAGASPALVWHSGKLRARQTAEVFLTTCAPFAKFSAVRGLLPEDPVEWIIQALAAEPIDVMVVGHMPHLPRLAGAMVPELIDFPLHGIVAMERIDDRSYREMWRAAP